MLVSVERNSNTLFYISISSRFNYIYFLNFYFYFYQILTAFNKLTIMSEVVLLLLNTDLLQQVDDYVRGCAPSTTYFVERGQYLVQVVHSLT
jgi:hypothetical protein